MVQHVDMDQLISGVDHDVGVVPAIGNHGWGIMYGQSFVDYFKYAVRVSRFSKVLVL